MTDISQAYLRQILSYNPDSGVFTWKRNGRIAGFTHDSGYRRIKIKNRPMTEHRLAWIFVYGDVPEQADHINGNKSDNRICNLRRCNNQQNQQNQRLPSKNNTSGFLGVHLEKKTGRWISAISINNKPKVIGRFDDPEEAHKAYLEYKRQSHTFCTI